MRISLCLKIELFERIKKVAESVTLTAKHVVSSVCGAARVIYSGVLYRWLLSKLKFTIWLYI